MTDHCHGPISNDRFILSCECQLKIRGLNLKLHRQRVGLSQEQFAARLSELTGQCVYQRLVSNWEREHILKIDLMAWLAIKKILEI